MTKTIKESTENILKKLNEKYSYSMSIKAKTAPVAEYLAFLLALDWIKDSKKNNGSDDEFYIITDHKNLQTLWNFAISYNKSLNNPSLSQIMKLRLNNYTYPQVVLLIADIERSITSRVVVEHIESHTSLAKMGMNINFSMVIHDLTEALSFQSYYQYCIQGYNIVIAKNELDEEPLEPQTKKIWEDFCARVQSIDTFKKIAFKIGNYCADSIVKQK